MSQSGTGHYEPIESASIDELRDLQLKRLGDTLSHAYANVAHYRHARDLAGHIKGNIGVTAEVAVVEPGAVPRSAGKAQRVVASR